MIAIPMHQSRVAPVLDWCSTIVLIPKTACKSWHEVERLEVRTNIFEVLRLLHSKAVSSVICGALSPRARYFGQHLGIEFISGISGAIDEVVEAYRNGELDQPRFRLPGCQCIGHPRSLPGLTPDHRTAEKGGMAMRGNQGKGGTGGGRGGQGRGPRCAGGGAARVMGAGVCFCPQCGREAPHRRGVPCSQSICVVCGTPLLRRPAGPGPSL